MAQIIRYWEYPPYSNKRTYNFDLMPNELVNTSSFEQIDEIAHLIADCGDLSSATYCIPFGGCKSGATINQVKRSLINDFKYSNNIEKLKLKNYTYDEWFNIIRNQIDNKMPVIIYGKDDGAFERHAFICDGYSTTENNYFHINTDNKLENWYYIPEDGYYTNDVRMLINIYPEVKYNCNSVVDLGVWYSENEDYLPLIDQPWAGTVLSADINTPENYRTVYDGDNINMHAYNSIVLRQGFSVKQGGKFHAYLTECPEINNKSVNKQYVNSESGVKQSTNLQNNKLSNLQINISPNPAENAVNIQYYLPQKTDYSIEIYNVFGQKVKNIENSTKNQGYFQIYVDLSSMQSGVYFCVLKTSLGVVSEKIIKI